MLGDFFTVSVHVPGTLAANETIVFQLPFDCSLVFVSAVGSNANNGILDVGNDGAGEAYVANMDIGDSSEPAVLDEAGDFEGDVFPHIVKDTIIIAAFDYDGAGGTATQNFTLVLGFTKG
jgi:hypothetical protein